MNAGLAGGSYFRSAAVLDAFSDENVAKIDWNMLGETSKDIFSSDFAMPYALAARGYDMAPWEDIAQMDKKKDKPLTGPKDAAFRHYNRGYPGGKPTYNMRMQKEDKHLIASQQAKHGRLNSNCQMCYNLTKYLQDWGSTDCTNHLDFQFSRKLIKMHFGNNPPPQIR